MLRDICVCLRRLLRLAGKEVPLMFGRDRGNHGAAARRLLLVRTPPATRQAVPADATKVLWRNEYLVKVKLDLTCSHASHRQSRPRRNGESRGFRKTRVVRQGRAGVPSAPFLPCEALLICSTVFWQRTGLPIASGARSVSLCIIPRITTPRGYKRTQTFSGGKLQT